MSVDSELLNKSNRDDSATQAGSLREAQRSASSSPSASINNEQADQRSLREIVLARRREELKKKAVATATAPVRRGTSKLLKQAWLNLVDSYGLTLIWIDIHVWLGSIFGNEFFCKLGAEWIDDNIKAAQAEYNKSQGGLIGTVEPMVLAGCNLGCLFIVIVILCFLSLVAHPKDLANLTWEAFKEIVWDSSK